LVVGGSGSGGGDYTLLAVIVNAPRSGVQVEFLLRFAPFHLLFPFGLFRLLLFPFASFSLLSTGWAIKKPTRISSSSSSSSSDNV
jgi:hypothetical protein